MGNLRRIKKTLALNKSSAYCRGECELNDLKIFTEGLPKKRIKCKMCGDTKLIVSQGQTQEIRCPQCNAPPAEKKSGKLKIILDFLKGLCYNTQKSKGYKNENR
jgi:ribosomal protein S27E